MISRIIKSRNHIVARMSTWELFMYSASAELSAVVERIESRCKFSSIFWQAMLTAVINADPFKSLIIRK